jgi:hypothetical protein
MKKLIFLLLMAFALVGFVSSGDAHPPGVITLEAALSGYGVDGHVVTPDTVLATVTPVTADPSSFQSFVASNEIRPHIDIMNITGMSTEFIRACTGFTAADYHLRC